MSVRRNPDSNRDNKLWEIAVIIAIPVVFFVVATKISIFLAVLLVLALVAYVFYKCGWNWEIIQENFWEFWYGIR